MKSTAGEAEAIHHQMARIRSARHEEISEVLVSAEKVAGWGRYVRRITIGALGAAAVLWIFGPRSRTAPMKTMNQEARSPDEKMAEWSAAGAEPAASRPGGVLALAANFLIPVIIRAAQNYAACALDDWLAPSRFPQPTTAGSPPNQNDPALPAESRLLLDRVNANGNGDSVLMIRGIKP